MTTGGAPVVAKMTDVRGRELVGLPTADAIARVGRMLKRGASVAWVVDPVGDRVRARTGEIAAGLGRFSAAFGRFERIAVGGKRILLLLIKNPVGANEAVRTLGDGGAPRLVVVALNDEIADGRDVSWIWDVDFEPLLPGLEALVASGGRAAELALRFRYGGLDEDAIEVEPDLEGALDRGLELTPEGGELVVLPTYTAMLGLQRLLASRGLAKPYWEQSG